MIRAHFDAISVLLDPIQSPPTGLLVYTAALDDAWTPLDPPQPMQYPYAVMRSSGMPVTSDRLAQWSNRLDGLIYMTGVGLVYDQAAWVLEKIRSVLLDAVPVVSGRSVAPLALVDSSTIEADRDVSPPLFHGVDVYRLFSV